MPAVKLEATAAIADAEGRRTVTVTLHNRSKNVALMAHLQPQSLTRNLSHLLDPGAEAINPTDVGASLWVSKSAPGLRILFGPQTAAECVDIEAEQAKAISRQLARMAVLATPISRPKVP